MTLLEAIERARKIANKSDECPKRKEEYAQLLSWLAELSILKDYFLGEDTLIEVQNLCAKLNLAISQLHGTCSACIHYTAYHQQGKCKNCCWDKANTTCLKKCQKDNWKWKGFKQ